MIVIKKYGNRRLYDTTSSTYVNLQQIADRIREGHRIKVVDAKDGDDLTQQILLQILLELQGTKDLLPAGLLHRMIRSTTDNPVQRLLLSQMATGLQLLDQQLAAFEGQTGWSPPPPPAPAAEPEPEPKPRKADAKKAEPKKPEAREPKPEPKPETKRAEPKPEPSADDELDDLRARLAALEQRLSGR
ncbi:MAG: hypothetical protein H6737_10120 [Alphaproteobacteria bacterium]|nr:hypothetical protein [Alphaproteobacteria bacterium]